MHCIKCRYTEIHIAVQALAHVIQRYTVNEFFCVLFLNEKNRKIVVRVRVCMTFYDFFSILFSLFSTTAGASNSDLNAYATGFFTFNCNTSKMVINNNKSFAYVRIIINSPIGNENKVHIYSYVIHIHDTHMVVWRKVKVTQKEEKIKQQQQHQLREMLWKIIILMNISSMVGGMRSIETKNFSISIYCTYYLCRGKKHFSSGIFFYGKNLNRIV